ncbi:MAG: leucine-rich repeat domain-containing protein [Deltaproteobacteria bacterium]|nr:leucine-rich repeat domain-containing protein [Deltaproteobacteria bacterium]
MAKQHVLSKCFDAELAYALAKLSHAGLDVVTPKVLRALQTLDWEAAARQAVQELERYFKDFRWEKPVGTWDVCWSDGDDAGIELDYSSSNDPETAFEDGCFDNRCVIDFSTAFKKIWPAKNLSGPEHWAMELGSEVETFKSVFLTLAEDALLRAIETKAFKRIDVRSPFYLQSALWHDGERLAFFCSGKAIRRPLRKPFVPPKAKPTKPRTLQILGREYSPSSDKQIVFHYERALKSLPDDVGELGNLEEIVICDCGLKALPASIARLGKVQNVDLTHNRFEQFPESLCGLQGLRTLSLGRNGLKSVPDAIGRLKKLQVLDLDQNQLEILPEAIGGLGMLKALSCGDRMKSLPASIGGLRRLEELLVRGPLAGLPPGFSGLERLKRLKLYGALMAEFPREILRLKNLEELELGDTPVAELPPALAKLPRLKRVRASPNRFSVGYRAKLRRLFGDRLFVGYDTDPSSFLPGAT